MEKRMYALCQTQRTIAISAVLTLAGPHVRSFTLVDGADVVRSSESMVMLVGDIACLLSEPRSPPLRRAPLAPE